MRHLIFAALICAPLAALATDYTDGILFINEDWYGHNNSSVNFLRPDDPDGEYWHYRVIAEENPGMVTGCTSQGGTIWDGRFYIISKQAKDPGSSIGGGRITVADAKSLKILHQRELIDPSGEQCDGRGFVGFDSHKGYISTSNGVWAFDLDTFAVTGQVEGTANPNLDLGGGVTNPAGSLYHGQSGTMVSAAGRVFAAHQEYGLLVIDPQTDRVTDTISMDIVEEGAAIGSVVKAKDGSLWVSIAADNSGIGTTLPYLLRVDPTTLATEVVDISGNYAPSNSWHSWSPDTFCASTRRNVLFWSGGPNSWFSGSDVYSMDVDTREIRHLIDFTAEGENWRIYGCSMRVDPVSDDLFMSLYHETNTPTYTVRRCDAEGKKIRDYDMISHYWFPGLPLFTNDPANISGITATADDSSALTFESGALRAVGMAGTSLSIYAADGREVWRRSIATDDETLRPELTAGIYVAHAANRTLKFVK